MHRAPGARFLAPLLVLLLAAAGGAVPSSRAADSTGTADTRGARAAASLPAGAVAPALRHLPSPRQQAYQDEEHFNDWLWSTPDDAYPFRDSMGRLGVATRRSDRLYVDTYDPATYARVGTARSISLSGWPLFGGFYAAPSGDFYVLLGKPNPTQNDALNVVSVRRYSSTWQLLGTGYVKGGASQGIKGIYRPFDAGAASMLLVGNRLVVHMARSMYNDADDPVHHQGNLTFEVAVGSMTATTFEERGQAPYASHSWRQYVARAGSSLLLLDHGDTYPRAVQLSVMADYPRTRSVRAHKVLEFGPGFYTGTTVDGLVTGPQGAVVIGTMTKSTEPLDSLDPTDDPKNAFLIRVNPTTGASTRVWLTRFSSTSASRALEPRIVQVATDRFAVLFNVRAGTRDTTYYRLVDSAGRVLAQREFAGTYFSSVSNPVRIGSKLFWIGIRPSATTSPTPGYLFALDVANPAAPSQLVPLPQTGPQGPVNVTAPRLRGRPVVGARLRVSRGEWDPPADRFRFRWFRNGSRMAGPTGRTFTVRKRDRGTRIRVTVVAVNAEGTGTARSNVKRIR